MKHAGKWRPRADAPRALSRCPHLLHVAVSVCTDASAGCARGRR